MDTWQDDQIKRMQVGFNRVYCCFSSGADNLVMISWVETDHLENLCGPTRLQNREVTRMVSLLTTRITAGQPPNIAKKYVDHHIG
jgi:hypothetical protein